MPITKNKCRAHRFEGDANYQLDWNKQFINRECRRLTSGLNRGTYGTPSLEKVEDVLSDVAGKSVIVLGTKNPWIECVALNAGSPSVWTWEYGLIKSTHPRLHAAPHLEMAASFASGELPLFHWAVSFSSLEHSGLGRYGDPLNPDGDAEALEEAWCMLRPGGRLALGMPMSCERNGYIEFNAHRVYGYERLAYISKGWELEGWQGQGCIKFAETKEQPLLILRKPKSGTARALMGDDFLDADAVAKARPVKARKVRQDPKRQEQLGGVGGGGKKKARWG